MFASIRDFMEQRLVLRLPAAQGIEANVFFSKINLASDQAMRPALAHFKALAEQMRVATLVGTAQVNYGPLKLSVQIQCEVLRNDTALRSLFLPTAASRTMRDDVAFTGRFELGNILERLTLPHLRLPQPIKAFDSILESRLTGRCEYGSDAQRQAQAADPTDSVRKLMGALELRAVVELSIGWQPVTLPAPQHTRERKLRCSPLERPGIDQPAVQRSPIEYPNQRPVGDLKLLNQIKGVKLRFARGHRWQIPTFGRRRAANAAPPVLQPVARKRSVNRGNRGHSTHLSSELGVNGVCSILSQDAIFSQRLA